MFVGSPEWFYEKSQTKKMIEFNDFIENNRLQFIQRFSPSHLMEMDGKVLLSNVFSDAPSSMISWLIFHSSIFGSAGKYKYLGIVYHKRGEGWKYKEGSRSVSINVDEAIIKAEYVRDQLISCVNEINSIGIFSTIQDYQLLQKRLEHVFFYKYPWVLKYYQMIYPQFFPNMYADKTLERALSILGLPNHGIANRIINAGEIALFIRKCDVNNQVFGCIYGDEWGWDDMVPPCQAASENFKNSMKPVTYMNLNYYKLRIDESI